MSVTSRISWLPALVWAGIIFYFSSIPGRDIPPLFPHADMVFHFFEYFIFCGLIYFGLKNYRGAGFSGPVNKLLVLALIISCFYAASDELHQLLVPGRCCDVFDFLVDAAGAAVFSGIKILISR